jgi:serine/threonine protein kinase
MLYQISTMDDQASTSSNDATFLIVSLSLGILIVLGSIVALALYLRLCRVKTLENSKEVNNVNEEGIHRRTAVKKFESTKDVDQGNSTVASLGEHRTEEVTNTVCKTNYDGLCIPLYRKYKLGDDFTANAILATGGFGTVFFGTLTNPTLLFENHTVSECVVKLPHKQSKVTLFLQELSIHEVFHRDKNFAKLLCYSDEPQAIVLKLYTLGSLYDLLFSKKQSPNPKTSYNANNVLMLAEHIVRTVNKLHAKSFIHNDIKLENVLLDSDETDPLFPVLTDFGMVYVLNSAEVVRGFEFGVVNGATMSYCAPEVLICFKNRSPRISTIHTDTYSLGTLLLELVTRKNFWKKFDRDFVINGGLPEMTVESILECLEIPSRTLGAEILNAIVDCLEFIPEKRVKLTDLENVWTDIRHKYNLALKGTRKWKAPIEK